MNEAGNPNALEGLSALVDGEGDARLAAAVSIAWRDDAATRARWHRYQLIGDVLRSEELAGSGRDAAFLAALRERLAREPAVLAPRPLVAAPESTVSAVVNGAAVAPVPPSRGALRRWAPPAALAAGFMVVAVGAITVWRAPAELSGPALAQALPEASVAAPALRTVADERPAADAPSFAGRSAPVALTSLASETEAAPEGATGLLMRDARLDAYLAAHQQFGGNSALGVPSGFLRNATHEGVAAGPGLR